MVIELLNDIYSSSKGWSNCCSKIWATWNRTWIGDAVPGLVVNINCHRPSIKLEPVCKINTINSLIQILWQCVAQLLLHYDQSCQLTGLGTPSKPSKTVTALSTSCVKIITNSTTFQRLRMKLTQVLLKYLELSWRGGAASTLNPD